MDESFLQREKEKLTPGSPPTIFPTSHSPILSFSLSSKKTKNKKQKQKQKTKPDKWCFEEQDSQYNKQ